MTELRQLENVVEIIGYLKSIDVRVNDGESFKATVTVEVHEGDKIHNHRVDLNQRAITNAGNENKIYKSYLTMVDEFKTRDFIEQAGLDIKPDLVRVRGEISRNQYYNSAGELKDFNNIRGMFVNREKDLNVQHHALVTVEAIVEEFEKELDDKGNATGNVAVKLFTNNYKKEPQYIKNTIVGEKLAEAFTRMYPIGSTAMLTMKLNNYAVVTESEDDVAPNAFGEIEAIRETSTVTDYVNNVEIVSGKAPYTDDKKFTNEMIAESKQIWNVKQSELHAGYQAPSTPQINTGNPFGDSFTVKQSDPFGNSNKIDISEDDLPF